MSLGFTPRAAFLTELLNAYRPGMRCPSPAAAARTWAAATVLGMAVGGITACSADPTGEMFPAPGITGQQPSDGTPVDVELVTPDRCPAGTPKSPWTELVAEGSLPQLVSNCQDHLGRGVYRYTVRMQGASTLVLSVGSSSTEVDTARALDSGQVSLDYQRTSGDQDAAAVAYNLFTDA